MKEVRKPSSPRPQLLRPPCFRLGGWWARNLPFVAIVALSAALRLAYPDLVPLKLDEVDALSRARELVDRGVLPATGGRMSWGLPDPPLVVYLLAIPALITREPAAATAFLGLLNTGAVALTYLLGAHFFGRKTGLYAGLLYAASPWAVFFARNPWVHVLPPLTALALYAAIQVVAGRRRFWAAGFFAALGLQGQTHLLAALYVPAAFLSVAAFPGRWLTPAAFLGLLSALMVSSPYLVYVWSLRDQFMSTISQRATPAAVPALVAVDLNVWAASGFHLQDLLGNPPPGFAPFELALSGAHGVVASAMAIGTIYAFLTIWRRAPGWEAYLLVLIWALAPVAILSWWEASPPLHYFTLLYPTQFLLAGLGMDAAGKAWRYARATLAGLAVGTAGVQAASIVALAVQLPHADMGGAFGIPASFWSQTAAQARALAAAHGARELYVLTRGSTPAHDAYPAAIAYMLGAELTPRFLNRSALAIPAGQPALYLGIAGDDGAVYLLERLGQPVGEVKLPGENRAARFYFISPLSMDDLSRIPSHPARVDLAAGLRFLGYDMPEEVARPGTLVATSYWLFTNVGDRERQDDMAFFNHLVDADGNRVAQRDVVGLFSWQWRNGELLIQRQALEIPSHAPPGIYRLLTGVYSRRDGQRVRLLDIPGDTLELGPVMVRP